MPAFRSPVWLLERCLHIKWQRRYTMHGFLIMVDCSVPQIAGLTVQNILFEPFSERLRIREAHSDFLHGFSPQIRKTGSTSSAFSCGRCASCLCLMKNQVLEPLKGKTGGFPSYFRLSATATATATVAPTIGLLPMPRKPIISTCAGTEEEPANWASECIRPMVSVIP